MPFRSIGFIPLMTTLAVGALFLLKFQKEAMQTEYALKLEVLINEGSFDNTSTRWSARQKKFLKALVLLDEAREKNVNLERLIEKASESAGLQVAYRPALKEGLLRNLELANLYGLLTEQNLERIEAGAPLRIGAGGYNGELAVVDNTVPQRYSPELEMRFANLLLKPESVVRRHPDEIGEGALQLMTACRAANLMTESSYARAMQMVRSTGVGR